MKYNYKVSILVECNIVMHINFWFSSHTLCTDDVTLKKILFYTYLESITLTEK